MEMSRRLQSRVGLLFVLLGVAGCSALPTPTAGLPLSVGSCDGTFPGPWEIHATLSLQQGPVVEKFLLALASTGSNTELAVLTPQGIPLYRIECIKGDWEVNRQARVDMLVQPERLLAWLQLIYLDESRISPRLQPGWDWQEEGSKREFYRPSAGRGGHDSIRIDRAGSGPWYESARLEDRGLETQLVIRILEASRVLPE